MIRVATRQDGPALQQSCFPTAPAELIDGWCADSESDDRVLLVATDDHDVPIGTCTLSRHEHRLERHRAEIGGFVITSGHRGTGVARQLVDACEAYAREHWAAQTLELSVRGGTHAEDAYRGLGFVEWGRPAIAGVGVRALLPSRCALTGVSSR